MARPKSFDKTEALQRAVQIFGEQGYAATSPDALMATLSIGRQSMYDTFGNKRSLFLTALDLYVGQSAAILLEHLLGPRRGLDAIKGAITAFANRDDMAFGKGCMAMNAIGEFGSSDPDIMAIFHRHGDPLRAVLRDVFEDAIALGQLRKNMHPDEATDYFDAVLIGIRAAAKMGKSQAELQSIASIAIGNLSGC
ncbi:hypothetical protein A6U86_28790 [Rhizobium sp. AC27/96]|uniref:TetR/AcrR family transcriptional regulator n=1 Tax=Rhizobium sp. AC27/96 TaxID=1841653 RepID=UPI000828CA4D|nr:TetR/AcrR family transcriptional regulator [Rhizobium sp. AC27/96]OCJ07724.1 hypothetical protein A6U86_28790 [Rhizobium sp. AC27/96]